MSFLCCCIKCLCIFRIFYSGEAALDEKCEYYNVEEAMIAEHKKVLANNFWIERSKEE